MLAQILSKCFLLTLKLVQYSNDLNSHQMSIQHIKFRMWWNSRVMDVRQTHLQQLCDTVASASSRLFCFLSSCNNVTVLCFVASLNKAR